MSSVRVRGRIRRVGNSLALLVPAHEARKGRLRPGQIVAAEIQAEPADALGLLRDFYDGPYLRRREGVHRDRI